MNMGPCLECAKFSFYYGKNQILDNISFAINPGDWLTIVGPNGSGKSTLLKNMLRLVDGGKTTGIMRVYGRAITDYSQRELAKRLAYVPQAGGRVPPFTVRDFVNLSRYPFRQHVIVREDSGNQAVERALALTNTASLADRRMDTLSGGQRQRVYLAGALAQEPDILLLDEPASFLDPRHVHIMNETLKSLHKDQGMTIVTVTHDLNQPLDTGGYVLALRDSKQIFFGEAEELANGKGILEKAFEHDFSYLSHPRTHKPLVVA